MQDAIKIADKKGKYKEMSQIYERSHT